jgi:nucleoside-diphosphate-sugar epimerase
MRKLAMAILVTGAAGFIGFHLCAKLLERGESVVGIDNLNDYYSVPLKQDRIAALDALGRDFRFLKLDFADHEALDAALASFMIDRIAHLGAQAGVRYSLENPRAYAQSNLVGHLNMLELARARQVRHLVYASSSSVYGGNESLPFRVEDSIACLRPACASSPSMVPGAGRTWRCGSSRRRSSRANPSPSSTTATCAATSPTSTTSSPASSPRSTIPRRMTAR